MKKYLASVEWGDLPVMNEDIDGDYVRVDDVYEYIKKNLGDIDAEMFMKELDKDCEL